MGADQAPESWIGETVVLAHGPRAENVGGVLAEVNDRGIVLRTTHPPSREDPSVPVVDENPSLDFPPWHEVRFILGPRED